MPQLDDTSTTLPLIIIGICFALMVIVWLLTLGKKKQTTQVSATTTSGTPIVGQASVTQHQIETWHHTHGEVVKKWIQNHEATLRKVSEGGLSIDLSSDLGDGHRDLGPAVDEAVAAHPSAPMRSQLSALVLASRNTLDALRRSNWTNAEKFHLSYLEYRDTWLNRLRKFALSNKGNTQAQPQANTQAQVAAEVEQDPLAPNWTQS